MPTRCPRASRSSAGWCAAQFPEWAEHADRTRRLLRHGSRAVPARRRARGAAAAPGGERGVAAGTSGTGCRGSRSHLPLRRSRSPARRKAQPGRRLPVRVVGLRLARRRAAGGSGADRRPDAGGRRISPRSSSRSSAIDRELGGPPPGPHNAFRGVPLARRDEGDPRVHRGAARRDRRGRGDRGLGRGSRRARMEPRARLAPRRPRRTEPARDGRAAERRHRLRLPRRRRPRLRRRGRVEGRSLPRSATPSAALWASTTRRGFARAAGCCRRPSAHSRTTRSRTTACSCSRLGAGSTRCSPRRDRDAAHSSGSTSRTVCVSSQRWPARSSTTHERSPYSHVCGSSRTRAAEVARSRRTAPSSSADAHGRVRRAPSGDARHVS